MLREERCEVIRGDGREGREGVEGKRMMPCRSRFIFTRQHCKSASLSTSDEARHTTAGGWREVMGSGRERGKQFFFIFLSTPSVYPFIL